MNITGRGDYARSQQSNELEKTALKEPSIEKCKVLCEFSEGCHAVMFVAGPTYQEGAVDGSKAACRLFHWCDLTEDTEEVGDTYILQTASVWEAPQAEGLLEVLSVGPDGEIERSATHPPARKAPSAVLSVGAGGAIRPEQSRAGAAHCVGAHCGASYSQRRELSGAARTWSGAPHVAFVLDAGKPVRALAVRGGVLYAASDGGAVTSWDIQRDGAPVQNVWRGNLSTAPGLENIAVGPNGLLAVHRGGAELYKGSLRWGLPAAGSVNSAKTVSSSALSADGRSFYLATHSEVWHIDVLTMREISRWSIGSLPKIAGRRRRDRSLMVRPLRNPRAAVGTTDVWTPPPHPEPDLRREEAEHLASPPGGPDQD